MNAHFTFLSLARRDSSFHTHTFTSFRLFSDAREFYFEQVLVNKRFYLKKKSVNRFFLYSRLCATQLVFFLCAQVHRISFFLSFS